MILCRAVAPRCRESSAPVGRRHGKGRETWATRGEFVISSSAENGSLFEMNSHPPYLYPTQWNGMMQNQPALPEQTPQQPWWAIPLAVVLGSGLIYTLVSHWTSSEQKRPCGVCGRPGHNRSTCPYDGPRESFSRAIPKSRRCQCCGRYGYEIQRHHARGRGVAWDQLDVCDACHVECGHEGSFRKLAIKPRVCRVLNRTSFWRS